jgi:hypothetical protein
MSGLQTASIGPWHVRIKVVYVAVLLLNWGEIAMLAVASTFNIAKSFFLLCRMFLSERILSTGVVQDKEKTVKSRNARIFLFIGIISFLQVRF